MGQKNSRPGTCDWHLKWGKSYGTEPFTCTVCLWLWVVSIRIELTYRTPRWCTQRIGKLLGVKNSCIWCRKCCRYKQILLAQSLLALNHYCINVINKSWSAEGWDETYSNSHGRWGVEVRFIEHYWVLSTLVCVYHILSILSLKQLLYEKYFMHGKSLVSNSCKRLAIWKQGQTKPMMRHCRKKFKGFVMVGRENRAMGRENRVSEREGGEKRRKWGHP